MPKWLVNWFSRGLHADTRRDRFAYWLNRKVRAVGDWLCYHGFHDWRPVKRPLPKSSFYHANGVEELDICQRCGRES